MRRIVLAAVLVTALVTASAVFGATKLGLSADKVKLAYNKKVLVAKHGKVTITMLNMAVLTHDIAIKKTKSAKKPIAKGQIVGKGKTSKVTANLAKGKYIFYCTVAGHEAGGMWGTLTVK